MVASIVIREAPAEVVQLAQEILESHHESLLEAKILFLFSNAKMSSHGNVLNGRSKKLTPEQRFLSSALRTGDKPAIEDGYDFIITISENRWKALLATQRKAMLDHELCHCMRAERINKRTGRVSYSWTVRGHDVEEFREIVERHGLWQPAVEGLVKAGQKNPQLPIYEVAPKKAARTTTVDGDGTVMATVVDEADSAPSTSPSEAPASVEEAISRGDDERRRLMSDLDEIISQPDEPKSREEQIADLDARAAALDSPAVIADWRERTGVGKTAKARARR